MPEEVRETPEERADRNFAELLSEHRVAQQGVQVLFAFLLTVPFTVKFVEIATYQKCLFGVSLISSALSTILFIAPVIQHRMLFRRGLKLEIIRVASRITQVALLLMLLSMMASVYLVTDVVFNALVAIIFSSVAIILAAVIWYIIPFRLGRKE